jgi:hypothetical protein
MQCWWEYQDNAGNDNKLMTICPVILSFNRIKKKKKKKPPLLRVGVSFNSAPVCTGQSVQTGAMLL